MRVRCEAVRLLDDPQPGWVEAYLTDCDGFRWQIVDKTVMFHEYEQLATVPFPALPMEVTLPCKASRDEGGDCVSIWLPEVSDRFYGVLRTSLIADDSN